MHAKCPDCGIDHLWQKVNFPVGTKVAVVHPISFPVGLNGETHTIGLEEEGTVIDHCDDGRAVVIFDPKHGTSTHTFHRITDYLLKGEGEDSEPKEP